MLFRPLINALFDVVPVVWDAYSNAVYRLVTGVKFEDKIEVEDIEINNEVLYEYVPLFEEDKTNFKKFKLDNKIVYEYIEGNKEGLRACVGVDVNGNNVWFNMLNSHLLIGGMARRGKSSLIRSILLGFMLSYTPNEVRFLLCDYKRADVKLFERYKHSIGKCSTNKEEFLKQLEWLYKQKEERTKWLEKYDELNMVDYNNNPNIKEKFPYIVFVVDELPQVMNDEECQRKLHLTMSELTYVGIYFILATQDCSKNVIGRCKMNCSQTFGFQTRDETDSKLLMPTGNLQDIKIVGRCKYDDMGEILEFQTYFTTVKDVRDRLEYLLKDNKKSQ